MRSYTPVVPSKTTPDYRPKWAKSILVLGPKWHKNPPRWAGTYQNGLYKGVFSLLTPQGAVPLNRVWHLKQGSLTDCLFRPEAFRRAPRLAI